MSKVLYGVTFALPKIKTPLQFFVQVVAYTIHNSNMNDRCNIPFTSLYKSYMFDCET